MASFLTKLKTKSETSSSTLQVQFKEIPNEDVGQDETLSLFFWGFSIMDLYQKPSLVLLNNHRLQVYMC
jgi:hypothetical protein